MIAMFVLQRIKGQQTLPGNEIRFFASSLHAHTAATGIWTKIVRNGKEVKELIRDDNYDFNFQVRFSDKVDLFDCWDDCSNLMID